MTDPQSNGSLLQWRVHLVSVLLGLVLGIVSVFAVGWLAGMRWAPVEDSGASARVVSGVVSHPAEPAPEVMAPLRPDAGMETSPSMEADVPTPVLRADLGPLVGGFDESIGGGSTGSETDGGTEGDTTGEALMSLPPGSKPLSRKEIDRVFRSMAPRFRTCIGPLTGGKRGDRVMIKAQISRSTGRVLKVKAYVSRGRSTISSCLRQAVRGAKFPSGGEGVQSIVHWITL